MADHTPSLDTARECFIDGAQGEFVGDDFDRMIRRVKADAIREYVEAARENPHTYYWPPSGVLDDAEQWADEIEKGVV